MLANELIGFTNRATQQVFTALRNEAQKRINPLTAKLKLEAKAGRNEYKETVKIEELAAAIAKPVDRVGALEFAKVIANHFDQEGLKVRAFVTDTHVDIDMSWG